jgi:hypothetical protein
MKTKEENKKKTFDAVKFMREQRDRISKDIMDLSPEEIVSYFDKKTKRKKRKPSATATKKT